MAEEAGYPRGRTEADTSTGVRFSINWDIFPWRRDDQRVVKGRERDTDKHTPGRKQKPRVGVIYDAEGRPVLDAMGPRQEMPLPSKPRLPFNDSALTAWMRAWSDPAMREVLLDRMRRRKPRKNTFGSRLMRQYQVQPEPEMRRSYAQEAKENLTAALSKAERSVGAAVRAVGTAASGLRSAARVGGRVLGSLGVDNIAAAQLAILDAQLADWAERDAAKHPQSRRYAGQAEASKRARGRRERTEERQPLGEAPRAKTARELRPVPVTVPQPVAANFPGESSLPETATPTPTRAPVPPLPKRLPSSYSPVWTPLQLRVPTPAELLSTALQPALSLPLPTSATATRLTRTSQPRTIPAPVLTAAPPLKPPASKTQECKCKPEKKRNAEKRCTNPIISRRTSKDGQRIITTRRLTCPPSKPKSLSRPTARTRHSSAGPRSSTAAAAMLFPSGLLPPRLAL